MNERILLVDDDAAVRDSLCEVLTLEHYEVLPAANGGEVWAICQATTIDAALLDLNLPAKSGWDIFAQLTNDNPLLPVIIITARSNQLFTSLGAGVGALMEKPLDFPRLLVTLRELLAESAEVRLARMTGQQAAFRYFPAQRCT